MYGVDRVVLTVFFLLFLYFVMKMATEQRKSKYHLGLSVHRVFWNMQWDMLG
jgi:hypothetical protein